METGTLAVPGAELYYELRGSGPVLLLVNGGEGDAGVFAPLAMLLAERYTVITYDPRGNSRSRLTVPVGEQHVSQYARDAHLLLRALCREPAYLFGTSYGGMVAMDLLAARPEQVRAVVAHESPLVELLPDAERWHASFQQVYETYQREGATEAVGELAGLLGVDAPPEPSPAMPPAVSAMLERIHANMAFCVAYELRSFMRYRPDLEALGGGKLTPAYGAESGSEFCRRTTQALAERLGAETAGFPGGHAGYLTHPAEFAKTLYDVLES
jgi:pimeloyl-ACP methyl ester carboxylesterase